MTYFKSKIHFPEAVGKQSLQTIRKMPAVLLSKAK